MCLGIPGQIQKVFQANGLRMGKLNFGGIVKDACLEYLPEAEVGDYAIVHVGFAISKLDEAEAQESLRLFSEMGLLEEELGNAHEPDLETAKITMPFSERGAP
jgi:hydrogenase expression/formation protein HypC